MKSKVQLIKGAWVIDENESGSSNDSIDLSSKLSGVVTGRNNELSGNSEDKYTVANERMHEKDVQ